MRNKIVDDRRLILNYDTTRLNFNVFGCGWITIFEQINPRSDSFVGNRGIIARRNTAGVRTRRERRHKFNLNLFFFYSTVSNFNRNIGVLRSQSSYKILNENIFRANFSTVIFINFG